ncbi:MAG: cache domain-containing protein [Candidatus Omnitrophica bacterium]|nr:cache domain-containing protein [Candidatus Omnitrophota bacterium]
MKRLLTVVFAFILSGLVLCLSTHAQPGQTEGLTTQDLLVKGEVETAISMLQAIDIKHQKGDMTLEQAKKLGADLLRELRYGSDGYFWADTTEGINVVHIRKGMEGRNRMEDKDSKGIFYIKEFMIKAKDGGGYVNYWFPKKDQSVDQPKRAYVALFAPFGWVVGSGYYY